MPASSASNYDLLCDQLVFACRGTAPVKVYKAVAKKYPNGMTKNFFEGDIIDLNSAVPDQVTFNKSKQDISEPETNGPVTRSKVKKGSGPLIVACPSRPTKGYSPILKPSSPGGESVISYMSLDDTSNAESSRRDSGVGIGLNEPTRERKNSTHGPLLYIGSSPDYNKEAMKARRSRSISLSQTANARNRSSSSAGSGPKRLKLRMSMERSSSPCTFLFRPDTRTGRLAIGLDTSSAEVEPGTTTGKKRSSPSNDEGREAKRTRLEVVDLTISEDETDAHKASSSTSPLSDINEGALALLEFHYQKPRSDLSSSSVINSDTPFMPSSPPVPQHSIATAAPAPIAATTNSVHLVLEATATSWTLRPFTTAAKAIARCQEHPVPVNHKKNKHRQRRDKALAVGEPIDVGNGTLLYVHDAAHNSVMSSLLGIGVTESGGTWGRKVGRRNVLGPECEKMSTWVEQGGFGDSVANVLPDVDAGIGAVPCLWFKIKKAVETMKRDEAERKAAEFEMQEQGNDVEMADAE
ncbi:hypothetical protein IWZ00DRAFT_484497 [Phyllosticta capitalensis]|uniref:Uncharacterized protein n=2 Tax=Phyllosticta capitalensis TaxID=121624 RepID=A0ABR1Z354_9PEZI